MLALMDLYTNLYKEVTTAYFSLTLLSTKNPSQTMSVLLAVLAIALISVSSTHESVVMVNLF